MLVSLFAALSLWPHLPRAAPRAPASSTRVERYQERFGGWWVDYARDRFAERWRCSVHLAGRAEPSPASFEHGAFVFRLGPSVTVADAVYRVDGGPPESVQAARPRLARIGAPLPLRGLDRETGGLVLLPPEALRGGTGLEIRPEAGARVRRFRLDGAGAALDAARAQGCAV